MLSAGPDQSLRNLRIVNKGEYGRVGEGIHCTPYMKDALKYTGEGIKINGQNYYLVFQCRARSKAIKVIKERGEASIRHSTQ